jgi:hypothetical protein
MSLPMKVRIFALGLLLALSPPFIAAQDQPPQSTQPSAGDAQQTFPLMLREGTQVTLKLAQNLDSKYAVVGEPVELVLAQDLKVYDAVVARKGARVLGTITAGKDSEKRGEGHALALRVDFLKVGAVSIKLRGEQSAEGKRNKDAMVAGTIFLGLSGLILASGKHYVLPAGTPAIAYVAEDVTLPPAA